MGDLRLLNYVHIMAGGLWTGIDLFMGIAIATLLSVIGPGLILPGEIKIYRQVASVDPDVDVIGRIGMRNARLGGLQGLLQLAIIFVMASLRFGS